MAGRVNCGRRRSLHSTWADLAGTKAGLTGRPDTSPDDIGSPRPRQPDPGIGSLRRTVQDALKAAVDAAPGTKAAAVHDHLTDLVATYEPAALATTPQGPGQPSPPSSGDSPASSGWFE